MVTYRCSNKGSDEADGTSSTSPPPIHVCDSISEESDETATAATTTEATEDGQITTQQQVGHS